MSGGSTPQREAAGGGEVVVGIALMAAATLIQPMMDATAKYLGGQMSPMQVAWARLFVQMLITAPIVVAMFGAAALVPRPFGLQVLRGVLLSGAIVSLFFAIAAMPLADAIAVVFVAPVIVTALSALVLGEHVGPRRWAAVAVGLVGALVIVRPGSSVFGAVGLLPLVTAMFYAAYLIVTRRLSDAARPMQTHFFTALVGSLVLAVPLAAGAGLDIAAIAPSRPDATQVGLLVLVGALSAISHLLIILGYARAPASTLAPIGYLEIVGATAIGFLAFGDFPDGWTVLGVGVIVASGLYVVMRERADATSARMHGPKAGAP